MRFISADVLFVGDGQFHNEGVVVVKDGQVVEVLPDRRSVPQEKLEVHQGGICPGFVNAHCHLELSHLLGKIPTGTGLPLFLEAVKNLREEGEEAKNEAMVSADQFMWSSGIDAVGDISNTTDSLTIKKNSPIHYQTFVEVIGLIESSADSRFEQSSAVLKEFKKAGLPASLAPHSPYSLSDKLRKQVANSLGRVSTIHNQECKAEDQYFINGTGKLKEVFSKMGLTMDAIAVTGNPSVRSVLPDFNADQNLILVHNSCTKMEEMEWANSNWKNLFWCSCPSANIYIEYRVPKVASWLEQGARVCLGTDSLASNNALSMIQEMSLTQMRNPDIPTAQVLQMATYNGARALGIENDYGLIAKGRKSGLLVLSNITSETSRINDHMEVTRLV